MAKSGKRQEKSNHCITRSSQRKLLAMTQLVFRTEASSGYCRCCKRGGSKQHFSRSGAKEEFKNSIEFTQAFVCSNNVVIIKFIKL
jgi:hypothetical protein